MTYGRGKPKDLIKKFVKMYVNDVTVNMGKNGEESINRFFDMAKEKKSDTKIQPKNSIVYILEK